MSRAGVPFAGLVTAISHSPSGFSSVKWGTGRDSNPQLPAFPVAFREGITHPSPYLPAGVEPALADRFPRLPYPSVTWHRAKVRKSSPCLRGTHPSSRGASTVSAFAYEHSPGPGVAGLSHHARSSMVLLRFVRDQGPPVPTPRCVQVRVFPPPRVPSGSHHVIRSRCSSVMAIGPVRRPLPRAAVSSRSYPLARVRSLL